MMTLEFFWAALKYNGILMQFARKVAAYVSWPRGSINRLQTQIRILSGGYFGPGSSTR